MTQQETFKRRIRERMSKTGERYAAARRELIADGAEHRRTWISPPEMGNDAVLAATGRGWDDWCDLIDGWRAGESDTDHTAIATYVREVQQVDPWWAQGVTVGYERITGLRLPYQRPDGTFTASKSKTVSITEQDLRALLLDEQSRADLFPGDVTQLRSKPSSKALRIEIGPGVAIFSLTPTTNGRVKVAVEHNGLPTPDSVDEWKFYWADWLDAIDESGGARTREDVDLT